MKSSKHKSLRQADSISVPLEMPARTPVRPVRRGQFWPGESFGTCTSQWDLTGPFANRAFALPPLSLAPGRSL